MQSKELSVRNVAGRYPRRPGRLRSENVEVQVVEVARVYKILLNDVGNEDAWMEITVEVEAGEESCVSPHAITVSHSA